MSILINIQGTLIDFPESAQSPNWAPAIIEFAQSVEAALSGVAGSFDISPQVYLIPSNINTNVDITNLAFPTSDVRSATINYYVYRQTDNPNPADTIKLQKGEISVSYNPNNPANNKWEISHEGHGDAQITFNITDTGQIQYTTTAIAGTNHSGKIGFYAKSITQS